MKTRHLQVAFGIAAFTAAAAAAPAFAGSMRVTNTMKDRWVWITTYQSGIQLQSFCVDAAQAKSSSHEQYGHNGFRVRAEVMSATGCKGNKICDTDMDVKGPRETNPPDINAVHIHRHSADPNRCYLSFSATPQTHKTVIRNTYKDRYVWITTTEAVLGGSRQINSGCIDPGKERTWIEDRYQKTYSVRAEVMVDAGCKGRKICDTKGETTFATQGKPVYVRQNATDANNCYVDWK